MVVEVLVTQRESKHALRDQAVERVFDRAGIAKILETGGSTGNDAEAPVDLAQQQRAAIGTDLPAVESGLDTAPADTVEIENRLCTLCHDKAAPFFGHQIVLDKHFVSETAALSYFIGEKCGLALTSG